MTTKSVKDAADQRPRSSTVSSSSDVSEKNAKDATTNENAAATSAHHEGKNKNNNNNKGTTTSQLYDDLVDDQQQTENDNDDQQQHPQQQPAVDFVLYLQQTGSIIALAKLMDALEYGGDLDEGLDDSELKLIREQQMLNQQEATTQ